MMRHPTAIIHPNAKLADDVEDRLNVRRRAADGFQNLASGGLILKRLGEIDGARLEFLEHADVFDGDHRLVGEGVEEIDVLSGERAHRRA